MLVEYSHLKWWKDIISEVIPDQPWISQAVTSVEFLQSKELCVKRFFWEVQAHVLFLVPMMW